MSTKQIGKYTINCFGNVCWIDLPEGRLSLTDIHLYEMTFPVYYTPLEAKDKFLFKFLPSLYTKTRNKTEKEMEEYIDELRGTNEKAE